MDMYDLLIRNLGMWLGIANQTFSYWMTIPANATGPLDPSITLTDAGRGIVGDIAFAAIQISQGLAEFVVTLFG